MSGVLENRSIIVTGGSTGIGHAAALRCAAEGALVTIADVNDKDGEATVAAIRNAGGEAQYVSTDVTDGQAVQSSIKTAVNAYGRLDGAFNNAGIEGTFTSIAKMSEADFDRTVAVDLKGVWLCVKYQVEQFLEQRDGGSIVSTASVAGLVGSRGGSAYCAAKHGVVGLTKSVALEYARKNIRVNAVCPGVIQTPMVDRMASETGIGKQALIDQEPMARLGEPREIGEAVVWLLSDLASFVTGISIPVDGGYTAL